MTCSADIFEVILYGIAVYKFVGYCYLPEKTFVTLGLSFKNLFFLLVGNGADSDQALTNFLVILAAEQIILRLCTPICSNISILQLRRFVKSP